MTQCIALGYRGVLDRSRRADGVHGGHDVWWMREGSYGTAEEGSWYAVGIESSITEFPVLFVACDVVLDGERFGEQMGGGCALAFLFITCDLIACMLFHHVHRTPHRPSSTVV